MARSSSLGTLYRYELKMLLRDKRMIFFSIILPLLIIPAFIFLMRYSESRAEERREERTYEYAVVGSDPALARELVREALSLRDPADEQDAPGDGAETLNAFSEVEPAEPDSALMAGEIDVVVEGLSVAEARSVRDSVRSARIAEAREEEAREGPGGRGPDGEAVVDALSSELESATIPDVPMIRLRFRGNRESSQEAASALRGQLEALREARRHAVYRDAGLPVEPEAVAAVEVVGVASAERESGAQLALWLTPILIMMMLSGGSVVAADAISGEKERGTLETLLTTSVRRSDIVTAKQLLIITVGMAITVINVAELGLFLGLGLFELPERFVISVPPVAVAILLLLFLPLTVLMSSVLLMLSGYSRSYKEYQIYFFPVLIIFLLPSMAAVLPGMELASVISVIPLANISVAVREVLVGQYDWLFLAITILSTAAVAAWLASLTERTLSTEKLISAAELDEADLRGAAALFPRRVLRWFALLWVVFFVSALWFTSELEIRGQVLFNVVGLFVGASLLMIRRYRLDPRRALALRMPRPAVWLGVLLGAPSSFIVGIGIAQLAQRIFPIPEQVLESFGQFMLPEELPLWQVLLFLAVLPGICEEIAFRGVLLHGLRRRFRPAALAVVVGVIFGLFHVDLFRIVPVSYLGIVLAGVTLATGSIFPAMLWHALNNAVALAPSYLGWWDPETVLPGWIYPAAAVGLVAALALIWVNRTPYPGLRGADEGEGAVAQPESRAA
jgi:ABC-type Na+ efflux pump permease subunit/membrane protease YdiL (CAAX protease family)